MSVIAKTHGTNHVVRMSILDNVCIAHIYFLRLHCSLIDGRVNFFQLDGGGVCLVGYGIDHDYVIVMAL